MFILDGYLSSFDRSSNNFGLIFNYELVKFKSEPLFNCSSSFHPKTPRKIIDLYSKDLNKDIFLKKVCLYPSFYVKIKVHYEYK